MGVTLRSQLTVDIAISAYNEERCIADILEDVMAARGDAWFRLAHISVISDASTDATDAIVAIVADRDQRVRLWRKPVRKGKNDSIRQAIARTTADVLVLLDADVRLASADVLASLLRPLYERRAVLVGANVIPVYPDGSRTMAGRARHFDWRMEDEARRCAPQAYWSFYGRALALSHACYSTLRLPDAHADDLFIYYTCLRGRQPCVFARDAIVHFQAPSSVRDFIQQYSRFAYYVARARCEFGRDLVDRGMRMPGRTRYLLTRLIGSPRDGLLWALCRLASGLASWRGRETPMLERGLYQTVSPHLRGLS